MKRLARPQVDDVRVLDDLAAADISRASRLLGPAKTQLADGYRAYVRLGGDVSRLLLYVWRRINALN